MYCPKCGEEIAVESRFCSKCGNVQRPGAPRQEEKIRPPAQGVPVRLIVSIVLIVMVTVVIVGLSLLIIGITVAVPKYQNTEMFMRETAALKAVLTIQQMEVQYQSRYGRYATSLAQLGPPASGAPNPSAADHQRRATAQLAMERNRLVAALADIVFVAHAAPSSKTAEFCREAWVGGKAMYTLDNPANAELISLGARPVTPAEAPLMFAGL